jgi:hypothetical protein
VASLARRLPVEREVAQLFLRLDEAVGRILVAKERYGLIR